MKKQVSPVQLAIILGVTFLITGWGYYSMRAAEPLATLEQLEVETAGYVANTKTFRRQAGVKARLRTLEAEYRDLERQKKELTKRRETALAGFKAASSARMATYRQRDLVEAATDLGIEVFNDRELRGWGRSKLGKTGYEKTARIRAALIEGKPMKRSIRHWKMRATFPMLLEFTESVAEVNPPVIILDMKIEHSAESHSLLEIEMVLAF